MRLPNVRIFLTASSPLRSFLPPLPPPSHADTFRPVVRGKRGVVAGGSPLSVEAGLRIFRQGGNATDAGVATILAASVIEFSHFSFGGEVPILIKLKGQDVAVVEGMGTAPAKATREFFVNRAKIRRKTWRQLLIHPERKAETGHADHAGRKIRDHSVDRSPGGNCAGRA